MIFEIIADNTIHQSDLCCQDHLNTSDFLDLLVDKQTPIMVVFVCLFVCSQDGYTAMMQAAEKGHVEIVQLLLNAGATVNDKDIVCLCLCACFPQFIFFTSRCFYLQ